MRSTLHFRASWMAKSRFLLVLLHCLLMVFTASLSLRLYIIQLRVLRLLLHAFSV